VPPERVNSLPSWLASPVAGFSIAADRREDNVDHNGEDTAGQAST